MGVESGLWQQGQASGRQQRGEQGRQLTRRSPQNLQGALAIKGLDLSLMVAWGIYQGLPAAPRETESRFG